MHNYVFLCLDRAIRIQTNSLHSVLFSCSHDASDSPNWDGSRSRNCDATSSYYGDLQLFVLHYCLNCRPREDFAIGNWLLLLVSRDWHSRSEGRTWLDSLVIVLTNLPVCLVDTSIRMTNSTIQLIGSPLSSFIDDSWSKRGWGGRDWIYYTDG